MASLSVAYRRFLLLLIIALLGAGGVHAQVSVDARAKRTVAVDGMAFKDLNGNGALDPYEDWRRPVRPRVDDLLSRMTLEEKSGLLLISTLNAEAGGQLPCALAGNAQAIVGQAPDAPGYDEDDTLFPFGHGLT